MNTTLSTPIEYLKGVGPQRADTLKKELGIFTYLDLLHHYPFRYIDRSRFYSVAEVRDDLPYIQLRGRISELKLSGKGRAKRLTALLTDESGSIELIWFQGANWILKSLKPNSEYIVFGKPSRFNNRYNIPHPELELLAPGSDVQAKGLQGVYPSTEKLKKKGMDSRGLLKLVKNLFQKLQPEDLVEILPPAMIDAYRFVGRQEALKNLHFPKNSSLLARARARMKFEELFLIQVQLLRLKIRRNESIRGFVFEKLGEYFHNFYYNCLPFQLTDAQKKVIKEIRRDTRSGRQMNRLLQGDVGSGKTVVSLIAMLIAIDNGFQACIMAPTEILAQQHLETTIEMIAGLQIQVRLLTGSTKSRERKEILSGLESGRVQLIIGTHALLEDNVVFSNLGMVIIDEQHRFGVAQRARLWAKNNQPPHVLVMTATPIPRTLAMTVYGDLDVSIIDELPPGRKPVKTVHYVDRERLKVFGFIRRQIAEGRQVYIVYPLIQESAKLDYKDLMDGYESIVREFPAPEYQISIVHGKMKAADKEYEMQRFAKGETQILVATTVIEVGVNVPNASVMVIESAERFGLSQLHQLRGRVGRGAEQSYCILMSGFKLSQDSKKRLKMMTATNDGFRIAEADLQLRGPGDLEGTQQSGILQLKLADISKDAKVLSEARAAANRILQDDPHLEDKDHSMLKLHLQEQHAGRSKWSKIS